MPEGLADKARRKFHQMNNGLLNVQADLYAYYHLLLRADPFLAAHVERMLLHLEDLRDDLHLLYQCAWESDLSIFDDIGQIADLLAEARNDVLGERHICLEYLRVWDRLVEESSTLSGRRAVASLMQSQSRAQSRQKLRSRMSSETGAK